MKPTYRLLAMLLSTPTIALALDVPTRYLVEDAPLRSGAVSGTSLTYELFIDDACTSLAASDVVPIDDVAVVSRLKSLVPRGGVRPPKAAELLRTVSGAPDTGPYYLRISGTGVVPLDGACQAQAAGPLPPAPPLVNLDLPNSTPSTGNILKAGARFIHDFGTANTFVGTGAGNFSMTGAYNTGLGGGALGSNTTGDFNVAVGQNALASNTTGFGNQAFGAGALYSNTTGVRNIAIGDLTLPSSATANLNIAIGSGALYATTTGEGNTAVGTSAMLNNTTGRLNVAVGGAMRDNTTGEFNVAMGNAALRDNSTGNGNVAIGTSANLFGTGSRNIAIGQDAGWGWGAGDDNIAIGSMAAFADVGTVRLGEPGTHTAAYVAGIAGATSPGGTAVFVDGTGKLGTITSSARFKTDVRDMADASNALMRLRPVAFRYKEEIDPAGTPQYGLIAEEVARVSPDLVTYDAEGRPETVRYHLLNAMLLNEVQRQERRLRAQAEELSELRARLDALETGGARAVAARATAN